ncbi:MAG TPA: hypothetical protein VM581_03675 [Magnetospirillaceae bacterium]|nr:hypothetical protein [Magnetospirillaceae bacterium]
MNEALLDDLAIEKTCKEQFDRTLDVADVIVRGMPAGVATRATLFVTTKGQVFLFVVSQSSLVLDDVRKIVHRMQCEAEVFVPPHGEQEYFERIGRAKFKVMFPGKHIVGEDDLRYYKNLAPYNPALILLSRVKGEVRGFEVESKTWRKAKDYTYSKIRTT